MTRVHSFLLRGIDAAPCEIEADISPIGQPKTTIVGLPDAAVKESAERVRTAMLNSGFVWPQQRITINLAPADQRKEGPVYDLPVAMAMLLADGTISPRSSQSDARRAMRPAIGQVEPAGQRDDGSASAARWPSAVGSGGSGGPGAPERAGRAEGGAVQDGQRGHDRHDPHAQHDPQLAEFDARLGLRAPRRAAVERPDPDAWVLAGELALDGRLRPVRGVISLAMMAKRQGRRGVVVPMANAREAAVVDGIEVRGAENLAAVVGFFNGVVELPREPTVEVEALVAEAQGELDFGDVRGQESAKRAMTIAAAGGHNILLIGPAGTGKTMMARALPGILPPLTRDEVLEVTRIYSSIGALPRGSPVVVRRPVRTPHHTASTPAIVGGGTTPRPGEVSLAHRGVLFLDELPEFSRFVLESLREPLEDGHVTIARAHSAVRFPARVMLVAAMNPTQQGSGRVDDVARDPRERYLSRLSGPLVDRIDLHVEVPAVPFRALGADRRGTDSATMRQRVFAARAAQGSRQGALANAELGGRELDRVAPLCEESRRLMGAAMSELGLSARAYDKVRRVSRTIADLETSPSIRPEHVAEAVQYRLLDRRR